MAYQHIVYETAGPIARVILNRPEKLNALNAKLVDELMDAVRRADADEEVRVIVLKANGRAFCAGYDITPSSNELEGGHAENIRMDIERVRRVSEGWQVLWNLKKPVIAQVHGYCLAGGTDMVLHGDLIVASEDALFGYPAVRTQGSPPTHMWTYLVGPQWAKYMLLTGNSIDGRTAERIGLIWKAVPSTELETTVDELAQSMSRIAWELLAANKAICNRALELMGRTVLQQLAAENDAVAHFAPAAVEMRRIRHTQGLKAAMEWRDAPFRDREPGKPE